MKSLYRKKAFFLLMVLIVGVESVALCMEVEANNILIKIIHDNDIPTAITKNIEVTPLFLLSSFKNKEGTIYAVAVTRHEYKKKEISFMEDACFNEATYFSLKEHADKIFKAISCPSTLLISFKEFFIEEILPTKIEKISFVRKGSVDAFAYALISYSDRNIEKTMPFSKKDLQNMFAAFIYKNAFESLQAKKLDSSLLYFKSMTTFPNKYLSDAYAFISFIELEEGRDYDFQKYIKKVNIFELTINGFRICARIFKELKKYDYANYFYSKILEQDPYDTEAKEYFQHEEAEKANDINYFFNHIIFDVYRPKK